jgi:RNA polymerase-associated protein
VLAEKQIPYEPVEIDLDDRPAWLYEKNPAGRVPVLEQDGLILPESRVIVEYLEERYPDPPLLPADAAERALARLELDRFDDLAGPYYTFRRERTAEAEEHVHDALSRLDRVLAERPFLTGREFGLVDVAYLPWILRAANLGIDVRRHAELAGWLDRVEERPAVRAEQELLAAV